MTKSDKKSKKSTHRHRSKISRDSAFFGSIVSAKPNPKAHGGHTITDTCTCGAVRMTNINGNHMERGKWL